MSGNYGLSLGKVQWIVYGVVVKILLTGSTGKVGSILKEYLSSLGHVLKCPCREELDLGNPDEVENYLQNEEFEVLINAAAMAGIEQCEEDFDLAMAVNSQSPAKMALRCRELGARLIHFSTDYVLKAVAPGLKDEKAEVFPNGAYGKTKLAGETAVLELNPEAVIARVSWVFGSRTEKAQGFFESVLDRALKLEVGGSLEGVADKLSSPTYVWDLAKWIAYLCDADEVRGIWHLTHPAENAEGESWHSYAEKALVLAYEEGIVGQKVEVMKRYQEEGNIFQILRPKYTALQPKRLMAVKELELRSWEEAGREYIRKRS